MRFIPINKKRIKRRARLWLYVFVCITLSVISMAHAGAEGYNWYCVHAKNHQQPCADHLISFAEDYGGYYIDHAHTSMEDRDKVVYLTFDVGYENGNVAKIMDVMKAENVTGAFFILGNVAVKNSSLVKRMEEEGHLVCNHTYSHRDMTGRTKEDVAAELQRLENVCSDKAGVSVSKYFRPPEGKFDKTLLQHVQSLGYKTVFWSFAYADWDNSKQMSEDIAFHKIMENVHNGEVMLLHPTSATNAAIMQRVIQAFKAQGYRFGSLDELTEA